MCQLLAICANREVDIRFSFKEWRHRGCTNPHGYGFAFWGTNGLQIVRAASNLYETKASQTDEVTAAQSAIFIAHVRFKSVGPQDGDNTHPFQATLNGETFAFAHNGTVRKVKERQLSNYSPVGQTDSEHAFLWLLDRVGPAHAGEFSQRFKCLADDLRTLGRFNFLMSNGRTLWAYADDRLCFLERRPPYGGELVQLRDDGYAIYLSEIKDPDERAVLVASEPLTDEPGWTQLDKGELLVIREGGISERFP
jgi:predicted glutamine amidotransferase